MKYYKVVTYDYAYLGDSMFIYYINDLSQLDAVFSKFISESRDDVNCKYSCYKTKDSNYGSDHKLYTIYYRYGNFKNDLEVYPSFLVYEITEEEYVEHKLLN